MAIFDVRNTEASKINAIVFADDEGSNATNIMIDDFGYIKIRGSFEDESVSVDNKSVHNLIKALQKSVELGWDKK